MGEDGETGSSRQLGGKTGVFGGLKEGVEVGEKWLDRIRGIGKDVVSDLTITVKDTLSKVEKVTSLQTEFESRMKRKKVQLDQKMAELEQQLGKGKEKKAEKAREKLTRDFASKYHKYLEQYPNMMQKAGEEVLYHREHLSKIFLRAWEEMEELSTFVFNSLREIDEEVYHSVNVDLSGLDALREAIQKSGAQSLKPVENIFLPKELTLLRKLEYRRKEEIAGLEALVVEGKRDEAELDVLKMENAELKQKCAELEQELEESAIPPPPPPLPDSNESSVVEEDGERGVKGGLNAAALSRLQAELEQTKRERDEARQGLVQSQDEMKALKREMQNISLRIKLDQFKSNTYSRLRSLSQASPSSSTVRRGEDENDKQGGEKTAVGEVGSQASVREAAVSHETKSAEVATSAAPAVAEKHEKEVEKGASDVISSSESDLGSDGEGEESAERRGKGREEEEVPHPATHHSGGEEEQEGVQQRGEEYLPTSEVEKEGGASNERSSTHSMEEEREEARYEERATRAESKEENVSLSDSSSEEEEEGLGGEREGKEVDSGWLSPSSDEDGDGVPPEFVAQ